eukprot:2121532-Pleurochrysis_carterae.AAC.1
MERRIAATNGGERGSSRRVDGSGERKKERKELERTPPKSQEDEREIIKTGAKLRQKRSEITSEDHQNCVMIPLQLRDHQNHVKSTQCVRNTHANFKCTAMACRNKHNSMHAYFPRTRSNNLVSRHHPQGVVHVGTETRGCPNAQMTHD